MILGSPARAVKQLSPEQIANLQRIAKHYVENAERFRKGLKKIG
jgi:carbonic anhydrase/acetyltransferase-like protein (isoleucine patch superfamily)